MLKKLTLPTTRSKEDKTTFYIVRHGQTDWNVHQRIQGHSDIPLNNTGRLEAAQLARKLKRIPFTHCATSDLQRAYETAQILTDLPIYTDKRLRERSFGTWEGKLFAEFDAGKPESEAHAEPSHSIQERALECLHNMPQLSGENHILIVTHGGVIRSLLIRMLKLTCSQDDIKASNVALLRLDYRNKKWLVEEMEGITLPRAIAR